MNKLFKVIWSKSKQCYIVVSEVAKNTTGKKKIAVASVLAALAVSAQVATVQAAIPEGELNGGAILAIGGNVKANGDSSVVIGKNNEVKTRFSVGIGNNILTESDNAVAIGSGSNNGQVKATGADSIAMGTRAEATKQSSIAIGRLSKSITDERGVAIGNEAVTTGYAAIAIGDKVNADSKDSISIGRGSKSKAEGAVVVGTGASAAVKNSVALGESSTVTSADAAETTGYLTNDTVNNSEHGVLSIGNGSTITRRILSVASGTNDTDAVNVKQLKALRNATVSTLSVVDGSTTTDVVPTTSVPASVTDVNERAKLEKELHKVKLVAGKNITLTANGNAVTIASKSEVNSITSTNADAISITTGTDGTVSVTPNLASDVNADADANKLVTAGKVKAALDQKANASDVNDLKAKLGNTAADGRDGKAAGTAGTTAAEKGLTGQDGLNGKSLTDKVNALRNGEAGSVVYTDDQGNRLVKANDGKYYKATQVGTDGNKIGDATPIGEDKLQASVMNPDGTKNPTKLSNLKDGKIAENSKDAVTGNQLHKVGKGLADALGGGAAVAEDGTITAPTYTVTTADGTGTETASNVGVAISKLDTRITTANGALVTKGLDFTGNDTTAKVHRDLGTTLTIKGAENFTRADAETNNIKVVNKNNDLDVKLAENLGNIKSISNATGAGKPGSTITLDADGVSIANTAAGAAGAAGDTKTVTIGKDGINAGKMRITNVATAEADGDVTNKQYVDGAVKALKDKVAKLGDTTADGRDGKAATGKAADDPDATAADKGLTGQDGLNGKSLTDKVNALRNGEAGSVVYTDDQGNRLVKANDGKYYKATQVGADGNKIGDATPIGEDKLQASVMNPDGTKNPTKLSNLKDGKIAENSKDAVTGNQLHKVGKGLADALGGGAAVAEDGTITAPTYTVTTADGTGTETASNVGVAISKLDTRITTANGALVTKGLDFTGNDTTAKVHRDLGTTLTIKGAENFTRADAETNNIKVVNKNNDLDVKLAENLGNIKSISNATGAGKPGSTITLDADGVSIANTAAGAAGAAGDTKTVTIGKDGINAGKMRITNVATAEADGDVTNKQYVDGAVKALKDKVAKLGDTTADGRDGKAATGKAADDPDATAADKGLTGQDGLNGKSLTDKVNALRNGEAGSVVYTDDQGNRLVKANDGKYYKATQVGADGNKIGDATPIGEDKLQASVMNPDGTKNPTKLSNLKDGKIAENSKDAVTGNQLYAAKAEVAKYLGGNAAVAEDGTITEPTYTIKDKDGKDVQKHNVGDALSTMNDRLNAANSAVTADITNLKNMEGLTAAGINKIKELAGQGVNVTGDKNITVEPTVEKGVKTFHATLSDDLKLGGPDKEHPNVRVNGTDSTVTAGTGDKEVKMNGADGTITAGDGANGKQVKLDGKDGSVQANKVTAGKDDKAVSLDGDTGTITAGTGENAVAINGTNATIKAGTGENQVGINGRDGSVTAKTVKAKGGNFGAPVDAKGIPTEVGTATSMDKDGFSVTSKDENGNVSKVTIKDGRVSAGNPVDAKGIPTEAGSATSMDKDGFSVATKDEKGNVSKVDIKNGGITAGAPVDAKGIPTEVGTTTSMDKDNGFSVTTKDKDGNVSKVTIKDGKISGLNGSEYDNYKKDDKGNIVKDKDGNPVVDSKVSVNGSGMTITPTEKDKQPVSLTKDGLNNGGNKITNVKDGVIAQGSNDVVNGNQIFNANTSIAEAIGGGAKVQKDGTISAPKFEITVDGTNPASKTPVTSVGAAIEALDARINNARNLGDLTPAGKKVITDLMNVKGEGNIEVPAATTDDKGVKTFTVKLKDTVTLGKGANQVQMDGTQGVVSAGEGKNKVEMNGAKGTITLGEKDGDTNVKLNASEGSVTANIGTFGAPVDGNGVPTAAGSATSMDKDGFSVTSKDEKGNVSKVTIKDGRVSAGNPVDANGIPAEAGSATSMDKDGFSVATKDEKGNVSKVDIKNGGITAGAPVDEKGIPTKEGVNTTTITDKGLSVVSKNADGTVSKVEIKDGKITGLNGSEYNNYKKDEKGNVVKDKDGKPVVDSSVKMDGAGLSIAPSTGDPKKSVSLTKDGLNNGGNRITNVADGIEDSDAATVGQVKEVTSKLGAALEKTSQRVSEVGAHSAALAAMNPLSYDPLRKSQIMAGIGSYDGNQALALGIAHYANENFMFNAGITMGSGKSMANIGATYRFGTGDDDNIPERYKGGPISSVYVMQDEITALKAENARKDAENAEMKAQIKMLMERMGMA